MTHDIERHDSDFGRLDRKPIEQVDWNKVLGFLLVRDNRVPIFFGGGNTECRVSPICFRGVS